MNEEQIIWSFIHSMIQGMSGKVYDWIKAFYEDFDCRKSLNRDYIVKLISELSWHFDCIKEELRYGKKDNH